MTDVDYIYYSDHPGDYHRTTFFIDPTSFLDPLTHYVKPPATILDVGCASGRDLLWFKKRGYSVLGLERIRAFAEMARKNADCEVIEEDFRSFDFTKLCVDAAILIGALVHLEKHSFAEALQRISQGVKPHGFLLLSTKAGGGSQVREDGRIFYLWGDGEIRRVLQDIGLDVVANFQAASRLGTGESWLAYVLQKPANENAEP